MKKYLLILIAVCFSLSCYADNLTGRDIAVLVDNADSSKDTHRYAVMMIERGNQKLIRKMEMWVKKYGKDRHSLNKFIEPIDIQDTQFLSWSYDDPKKEDDLWVYFPSENMVRRISGGGKKSAFMRSDFALEDMEYRHIDSDTHQFIKMDTINNRPAYVIESTAIPEKQHETNYSKRRIWVDKEYNLPVKIEYIDHNNKLSKTLQQGDFKQIDNIWTPTKLVMQNNLRNTRTLMQYSDTQYNTNIADNIFDQNKLKR